jgi:hypothetical protein
MNISEKKSQFSRVNKKRRPHLSTGEALGKNL